jgi:hypothetical protein
MDRNARGLCADVEGTIGATSWPIEEVVACLGRCERGCCWLMTECNCDLRRLGGGWSSQLRSGLGTEQERSLGGPAFAPALLRACPYIFLSWRTFSTLIACDYSTTHQSQCLRSESPFQSARRRVCATVFRKSLPRSKESSVSKQKTFVNFSSTNLRDSSIDFMFLEPRMEI